MHDGAKLNGQKDTTPLVSVIIPVFNTEALLSECLESVLKQSTKAIEILIVDDGSTDNSKQIAEEYARQHPVVRVFQQSRKRQGAARNLALGDARGRYVSFLDSDDTLPHNALKKMVDAAENHDSDMVCGIQRSFSRRRKWVGVPVHQKYFNQLIGRTGIRQMPALLQDISVCNRLIRRETIEKNGLRFLEGTAGEDLDFMARLYLKCDVITILPEVVYNYRGRNNSRTSRISRQFFEDRVAVTEALEQFFINAGNEDIYPYLLRSEIRKLVGNRFLRVVEHLPYGEQLEIFDLIHRLVSHLTTTDMLSDDFKLHEQARIIMLAGREYDALIAYECAPDSPRYIHLIRSETTKSLLFEPLMQMQLEGQVHYQPIQKLLDTRQFRLASTAGMRLQGLLRALFRIKLLPTLKYFITAPMVKIAAFMWPQRDIWLMDERVSTSAEDNGYFFFKYLRETYPQLPVFYVIKRNSPHWNIVAPLGNVVAQYSWKHAYLLPRARVMLSTDCFRGLDYLSHAIPRLRRKTLNIFLQHGVSGNKTTTYTRDKYPYFSQVVVSNRIEQALFSQPYYGFTPSQIKLTGIARLDSLPTKPKAERSRKVLVTPTWRRWLKGQQEIQASRYYYCWNNLLNSDRLADILERYDVDLYFRPHFNMMHFVDEFEPSSPRVRVIRDLDEPLHGIIANADLLITDYSSVMYDFFYQEKPVIGYMFDRIEWEQQPPGPPHLDYEADLALDLVTDTSKLFERLEAYLKGECAMSEINKRKLNQLFEYRDGRNCERIYQVVQTELKASESEKNAQHL